MSVDDNQCILFYNPYQSIIQDVKIYNEKLLKTETDIHSYRNKLYSFCEAIWNNQEPSSNSILYHDLLQCIKKQYIFIAIDEFIVYNKFTNSELIEAAMYIQEKKIPENPSLIFNSLINICYQKLCSINK